MIYNYYAMGVITGLMLALSIYKVLDILGWL
jgi:hypothetical protein